MSNVCLRETFKRCVLHVAPVLAEDVRNQLLALEQAGLLQRATSLFVYSDAGIVKRALSLLDGLLGCQLLRKTSTRQVPPTLRRRCSSVWWTQFLWQARKHLVSAQGGLPAMDQLLGTVDRQGASTVMRETRLTIGREDSCLASFAASRKAKARCLYDLPTCHYSVIRPIMEREEREFPDASLDFSYVQEYHQHRNERKDRELTSADHVLVASEFVRMGLTKAGFDPGRITAIPYGCEPRTLSPSVIEGRAKNRVILYVGNLSLRKGIPRLLRAWKRLGAYRLYRLRLIGTSHLTTKFLSAYSGCCEHIPRLPRSDLWDHYAAASTLVFPSIGDGFGLVMNEALSCALPVIASANSGAPGFITHGQEGLLYQYDNDDALCTTLDRVLTYPRETAEMGRAAYHLACGWTWREYHRSFVRLVCRLLSDDWQTIPVRSVGSEVSEFW